MNMKLLFLAVCILFRQLSIGQGSDSNTYLQLKNTEGMVANLYEQHAVANKIPGVAFAVVYKGKVVYQGFSGYANLAEKTPVNKNSAFRIASIRIPHSGLHP
jgi:CubicO group peptidase (beta-lactamase class C family)